jgi:hypothetical protein
MNLHSKFLKMPSLLAQLRPKSQHKIPIILNLYNNKLCYNKWGTIKEFGKIHTKWIKVILISIILKKMHFNSIIDMLFVKKYLIVTLKLQNKIIILQK